MASIIMAKQSGETLMDLQQIVQKREDPSWNMKLEHRRKPLDDQAGRYDYDLTERSELIVK